MHILMGPFLCLVKNLGQKTTDLSIGWALHVLHNGLIWLAGAKFYCQVCPILSIVMPQLKGLGKDTSLSGRRRKYTAGSQIGSHKVIDLTEIWLFVVHKIPMVRNGGFGLKHMYLPFRKVRIWVKKSKFRLDMK